MTVRTDRLLELADIIEAGEPRENIQGWNMAAYNDVDECGTVGCIGGWTCAVYDPEYWSWWQSNEDDDEQPDIDIRAAELLGLDPGTAWLLFMGIWSDSTLHNITRHEAAAELRRLAKVHGEDV